jgi:hypothetical protein
MEEKFSNRRQFMADFYQRIADSPQPKRFVSGHGLSHAGFVF